VQDWLRLVPVGEKVDASLRWMIVRCVRYELFSEILRYR
jgi:hypothetical protein